MKKKDHQLVQQVLDGDMSREAFDAFQQRLRDEPDLAKLYADYAMLQHSLYEEYEGGHDSGTMPAVRPRHWFATPVLLGLATALVVAAVLLWFRPWAGGGHDVAMVLFAEDAVGRIEGASRNLGGATGMKAGSVVHLDQGLASISLEPAGTAVIEGPAEVHVLTSHSLRLAAGTGYFSRKGTGPGLTIMTPKLTAENSGARFGVVTRPDAPDEIEVMDGLVHVVTNGEGGSFLLRAGEAAKVRGTGEVERFPAGGRRFATGLGRFHPVVSGPFVKDEWRVEYGNPTICEHRIEGANYSIFKRLPGAQPPEGSRWLLATLEVGKPVGGEFHSDGWAGMSFYGGGNELLFYGDSFGSRQTWSLDVKQHVPLIMPAQSVTGPRTVTLRYDSATGDVSLHEGGLPLKAPFCVGKLPVGSRFDEIRIGASSGAALTVNSLQVRVGGD